MKKYLLILVLCFLTIQGYQVSASAADYSADIKLHPAYKYLNDYIVKWGYTDINGKFIIKPKFDRTLPFSEGLAPVGIVDDEGNLLFGYIDKTGKFNIKPRFVDVGCFVNGKAPVILYKGNGVVSIVEINRQGKVVRVLCNNMNSDPQYGSRLWRITIDDNLQKASENIVKRKSKG